MTNRMTLIHFIKNQHSRHYWDYLCMTKYFHLCHFQKSFNLYPIKVLRCSKARTILKVTYGLSESHCTLCCAVISLFMEMTRKQLSFVFQTAMFSLGVILFYFMTFLEQIWQQRSNLCKKFIRTLLTHDSNQRPTCFFAL